jgi:hypothetical protein
VMSKLGIGSVAALVKLLARAAGPEGS